MEKKFLVVLLALVLCLSAVGCGEVAKNPPSATRTESTAASSQSAGEESLPEISEPEESESVSEAESSKTTGKAASSSSSKPSSSVSSSSQTVKMTTEFKYNTNTDIDDNVFMDALIYTGYNITKHRSDGNMWVYILAKNKRGLGYLSDITYGGGCLGYETKNGKPDLAAFKRGGLVCASYVTYVYFNYLPNVAGIDTSSLTTPGNSHMAHDWYQAAKDWVKKGYSKKIPFTASLGGGNFTVFKSSETIPIGSIVMFKDFSQRNNPNNDHGTHVCIYAGYKNGYNWVYHVGNKNGPEFCAIERMSCGVEPQWPLAVFSTPSNIRMSAMLTVKVTDENGAPVKGASFTVKNKKTGATTKLGKTGADGTVSKEGLKYGEYLLTETVPTGYSADKTERTIMLNTAANSANTVTVKNTKQAAASSNDLQSD